MEEASKLSLKDGDSCKVVRGTHAGKSGRVQDINTSKTGHVTITVLQEDGERFKTLGRNVVVISYSEISMAKPNEQTHPNQAAFPAGLSGPALRALDQAGIRTVADLSQWTESGLAGLHGMGPKALTTLREALSSAGRHFRSEK